VVILQVMHWLD